MWAKLFCKKRMSLSTIYVVVHYTLAWNILDGNFSSQFPENFDLTSLTTFSVVLLY